MLWRRHYPKEEAVGEAERRKEENAPDRKCGDSAESIYERFETGRQIDGGYSFREEDRDLCSCAVLCAEMFLL